MFELVRYEFLSEEGIRLFVSELEFNDLDSAVWSSITRRLVLPLKTESISGDVKKRFSCGGCQFGGVECAYNNGHPLEGIFKRLTDSSGGNIKTNGTIEMTCSRLCCGKLESIVDSNNSSQYAHIERSSDVTWLKIDFKKYKVHLKSYVIKARDIGNVRFMRSWRVEISNDGNVWEMVDEQRDVSELNGQDNIKMFEVEKSHQPFRFIRIFTDQDNWSQRYGNQGFSLGNLELFGQLIE